MAERCLASLVDWQRLVQILKLHHLTAMKNPWSRNLTFLQCLLSLKRIWQKTILHNLVRLMLLFLMNHFRLCLEVRRRKRIKFPASDSSFCLRKENFGTSTRHSLGIRCWQWALECPSSPACENRKCSLLQEYQEAKYIDISAVLQIFMSWSCKVLMSYGLQQILGRAQKSVCTPRGCVKETPPCLREFWSCPIPGQS